MKQLCLVGSRQFNTFGAHGASEHVDFRHYPTLEDCVRDLKQNKGGRRREGARTPCARRVRPRPRPKHVNARQTALRRAQRWSLKRRPCGWAPASARAQGAP